MGLDDTEQASETPTFEEQYGQGQSIDPTPLPTQSVNPNPLVSQSSVPWEPSGSADRPMTSNPGEEYAKNVAVEGGGELLEHAIGTEIPFVGALVAAGEQISEPDSSGLEHLVEGGIPILGAVAPLMMGYTDDSIVPDTGGMTQGEVQRAYLHGAQSVDPNATSAASDAASLSTAGPGPAPGPEPGAQGSSSETA
jgi:hypothetical protein